MKDLSTYSDADLLQAAGFAPKKTSSNLSQISDADLIKIAGTQPSSKSAIQNMPQAPVSAGRTALDQGLQGATFGFGDEVSDALGADIAKIYNMATGNDDRSLGQLYNDARQNSKNRINAEMQQRPGLSIASNIAGGVLTGGAGATTKTGTALANSLRSGNLAARAAKGAIAGAASGGLYGAGAADDGQRLEGTTTGALTGATLGAALPIGGAAASGIKNAILPKASESLKPLANKALQYGIPLSRTQIGDSTTAKTIASASGKIPLSGAKSFQNKQLNAWNRELWDTVGATGDKLDEETWDKAAKNIGEGYDKLFAGKTVPVTEETLNKLSSIQKEASYLGSTGEKIINKHLDDFLKGIKEGGNIEGETLNNIRSRLGKSIKSASTPMSHASDAKDLLNDFRNTIVNLAVSDNPTEQKTLYKLNTQWKNLRTIQPLIDKNVGGYASPSLLLNQVKKSYGDNLTRGNAGKIGDLARIGQVFLKDQVPDSGTAQRMMVYKGLEALGAGGAGALAGGAPGALAAIGVPIAAARGFHELNTFQPLVRRAIDASKHLPITTGLLPANFAGQTAGLLNQ